MKPNRHALIFSTVWPEPDSSAAGVRQMHWIELLLQDFERVSLISPAKPKQEQDWGRVQIPERVEFLPIPLNDWSLIERLKEWNPELVLFDRFILEEQYGAMVYEALPHALVLMETQDLHFVRRARERVRESGIPESPDFYKTETALRETASLERVDYSFVVSSYEERLLREEFGIGPDQQAWVPFSTILRCMKGSILNFQSVRILCGLETSGTLPMRMAFGGFDRGSGPESERA